jgi:hypothetical protein
MRDISRGIVGLLEGFLCGVGRCIQMLMLFVCEQIFEKIMLKWYDRYMMLKNGLKVWILFQLQEP